MKNIDMESMEKPIKSEIKTEELLAFLEKVQWQHGNEFDFNGSHFRLHITGIDELRKAEREGKMKDHGEPSEFHQSTATAGYDIYLHDTIWTQNRKRILFHEILEANLIDRGISETLVHDLVMMEETRVFGPREK